MAATSSRTAQAGGVRTRTPWRPLALPLPRRPSPYKGLSPFDPADAAVFFGRGRESRLATANLIAYPLTVLYGPTGVGKSSLLRAGVLPRLDREGRASPGEPGHVAVLLDAWAGDPSLALQQRIGTAVAELYPPGAAPPAAVEDDNALVRLCRQVTQDLRVTLLLLLDQFEELFNYQTSPTFPRFADQLAAILRASDLRVNVLLSLRDDTLSRLDHFKGRIPALLDNRLSIEPLSASAARDVILRPVEEQNRQFADDEPVTVDEALVEEVIRQVSTGSVLADSDSGIPRRSGPDPSGRVDVAFLQMVMQRLWNAVVLERGERRLTAEALRSLGGAQTLIATHVAAEMSKLGRRPQLLATRMFQHLVTPSGLKIALPSDDLAQMTGGSREDVEAVARDLAGGESRLLRTQPSPDGGGAPHVALYHDVLAPSVIAWRRDYLRALRWSRAALHLGWWTLIGTVLTVVPALIAGVQALRLAGRRFALPRRKAILGLVPTVLWGVPITVGVLFTWFSDTMTGTAAPSTAQFAASHGEPVDAMEIEQVAPVFVSDLGRPVVQQCYFSPSGLGTAADPSQLVAADCDAADTLLLSSTFTVERDDTLFLRVYDRCGTESGEELGLPAFWRDDISSAGEILVYCFSLRP